MSSFDDLDRRFNVKKVCASAHVLALCDSTVPMPQSGDPQKNRKESPFANPGRYLFDFRPCERAFRKAELLRQYSENNFTSESFFSLSNPSFLRPPHF